MVFNTKAGKNFAYTWYLVKFPWKVLDNQKSWETPTVTSLGNDNMYVLTYVTKHLILTSVERLLDID